LYLGSKKATENKALLSELGITHIVNVTQKCRRKEEIHGGMGDMHLRLKDAETERLSPYFEQGIGFIHAVLKPVAKCSCIATPACGGARRYFSLT
jgi:hypothetical protein